MTDSRKMLNLPVLKRHDASIVDIVDQFSHVQLYRWDGSLWTKDAIQGPLFLFKRSGHPRYGFFILNKHGLKNFSEDLTGETSVQLEDEIVIVTCGSPDPNVPERTYGLWSSEQSDRGMLYERVSELSEASGKALQKSRAGNAGANNAPRAISLDALFGTQQQAGPASDHQSDSAHTNENSAKGLDLLDSIFSSAQPQTNGKLSKAAPQPSVQQNLGASQRGPAPAMSQQADDAAALMAMIGLTPSSGSQDQHRLHTSGSTLAPGLSNSLQHSSGSSTVKASAHNVLTPGPPPAVPQETRPPVVPQQQHQSSPAGQTDTSSLFGQGRVQYLPRGLDRGAFPGELVKTLFAEPKLADALFALYQSGQL